MAPQFCQLDVSWGPNALYTQILETEFSSFPLNTILLNPSVHVGAVTLPSFDCSMQHFCVLSAQKDTLCLLCG